MARASQPIYPWSFPATAADKFCGAVMCNTPNAPHGTLLLKLMDMMGVKQEQCGNSIGVLGAFPRKPTYPPNMSTTDSGES